MTQIPIWVLFISLLLLLHKTDSVVEEDVKSSLINFISKLSNSNGQPDPNLGWNMSSDPCTDKWNGVSCDGKNTTVRKINLDRFNLAGTFDATSLCSLPSLADHLSILSLKGNNISGQIPVEIANCKQLTHLHINGNQFSGNLPVSLPGLNNLKRLEISNNKFSGDLPDLSRISGLTMFLAQYNQLTGKIPEFDFSNLDEFNVSYNNFSGRIPDGGSHFSESSFFGNEELCGKPLPKKCPPSKASKEKILMYSGYILLGLAFVIFFIHRLRISKNKMKEEKVDPVANKVAAVDDSSSHRQQPSAITSDYYKTGVSRSEISMTSVESAMVSSSLVVLTSPVVNGLRFEDLLKAPAELLGRGKHSSVYKVIFEDGMTQLAVKRIKDWAILSDDFKQRMQRIDQVKHPNVLPVVAFYCSKQEKLLVYEYQQNGCLFKLLHGTQTGQAFDWGSRLSIAASIAEALAFMHQELREDGIDHGNLKSSNILFNKNMEPCISEYGLMAAEHDPNQAADLISLANVSGHNINIATTDQSGTFKVDIYGFGVILLELLTGKLVQQNGFDLTRWVHSVLREEWTVEVFDKSLLSEGASEESMVNLLQVAIKCVNHAAEARPTIGQVAVMINSIKEEEERSIVSEV